MANKPTADPHYHMQAMPSSAGNNKQGQQGASIYPVAPLNALVVKSQPIDYEDMNETTSLVELSISCTDLPNCDVIGKSDPQVIVYLMDVAGTGGKIELGRTEVIRNELNPNFVKKIVMKYHFEQIQKLRFEIFDIDMIGQNDFLGYLETTLADVISARGSKFRKPLLGGPTRKPGHIILNIEELNSCKQIVRFTLCASDLPNLCCGLFRPSASVNIYKTSESGSYTVVHRSQPVNHTNKPTYKRFDLKMLTLCNGDLDRVVRFEFVENRFNLGYPIGFFETTINALSKSCRNESQVFDINTSSSKAIISDFSLINQASFLDYIKAGTEIHFVIAIDFTASNGDPSLPDSLHFIDRMGRRQNPYESALIAVGNILKPYDTTGLFAGFGFGAKLLGPNKPPSHLFSLNGNDQHPYMRSIEEIVQVYRDRLSTVILSGPTNFSPCIAHCSEISRQFGDGNHYFVLLIVTDGIISDMEQTKRAIINASKCPLSIIICGVGDADFSAMHELDSDDVVMKVDGRAAERDIVQFVPFNQFIPNHAPGRGLTRQQETESQKLLAEEVLREIPDQLTGYMVSKGYHQELTHTEL